MHRFNVNLPLNLCKTHLQKSKNLNNLLIADMQEIFFPLNSQTFLVNSVASTWVSEIFSRLNNSQILYYKGQIPYVKFQN